MLVLLAAVLRYKEPGRQARFMGPWSSRSNKSSLGIPGCARHTVFVGTALRSRERSNTTTIDA